MQVRGAYMSIREFLYTYRQGVVYSEKGTDVDTHWYLEAKRKLIIPNYQREYRWAEKQLTELLYDINRGNCYLGQIAVARNISTPKNYYLVDGQQRITSIIILLTILCRQFYIYNDSMNIKIFELHFPENNSDDTSSSRLCFETNCFDNFQNFIAKVYRIDDSNNQFQIEDFIDPTKDSYQQKKRYINACTVFHNEVKKQLDLHKNKASKLSYVKELLNKILNTQISVVIFEGDNSYESEKVFLDINEKGLRLDNEDILKAYYFQSISTSTGTESLKTWQRLKENYFNFSSSLNNNKIPLETFVNYALQIELLSQEQDNSWDYSKFDDDLRYKDTNGKKHICELFIDTNLHDSIKLITEFFKEITGLLENDCNSYFYTNLFNGRDSTTRQIFKLLFTSICKADMRIIYIALIKIWWLRKSKDESLTLTDVIQLFSFYIISNISGLKKERQLFTNDFISSQSMDATYKNLHIIETKMLDDASSKITTLKSDQEKSDFLSFNIQMFYNDFKFDQNNKYWKLNISNQEFLNKYSSNRKDYGKDHFLIQNSKFIQLYNNELFTITRKMISLRKRAYNFIYHKDTFGNVDFITRLDKIISERDETTQENPSYGKYENNYFKFIEKELQNYFDIDKKLSSHDSWSKILTEYNNQLPNIFPKIISYILEEHIISWNQSICKYFANQFPDSLKQQSQNK